MSYSVRYRIKYYDLYNRLIVADIEQRDYTGAVEVQSSFGSSPINYSIGEQSDDPHKPIKASSVDVTFIGNVRLQFFDLYSVDESMFRLKIYVNDVIDWCGLIVPDLYTEPFGLTGPREVGFTFSDGISFLSDIDYDPTMYLLGYPVDGIDHIRQMIQALLSRTGQALPLWLSVSFLHSDSNTGPTLDKIKLNRLFAETLTCYDALEIILKAFDLRLYLEKDHWRIDQIFDLSDSLTFSKYGIYGANLGSVVENVITVANNNIITPSLLIVNEGSTIKTVPAWRQFSLKVDYNKEDELAPQTIAGWGSAAQPPTSTRKGQVFAADTFIFDILGAGPPTIDWATIPRAEATIPGLRDSDEQIILKFKYMCAYNQYSCDVYIMVTLGGKYLDTTGNWIDTVNRIKIKTGAENGVQYDFELNVQPMAGTLVFTIYQQVAFLGGGSSSPYLRITSPSVIIYANTGKQREDNLISTIAVSDSNNFEGDDLKMSLCDAPAFYNNAALYYRAVLQKIGGGLTSSWSYKGITGRLQDIMPKLIGITSSQMRFGLSLSLISDYMRFKNVLNVDGHLYLFTQLTYDYKKCTYTADMTELPVLPPVFGKLAAYFYRDASGVIYDLYSDLQAVVTDGNITWPEVPGYDIFDFSDATYWDNTLLPWYNATTPRTCPLSFIQGAAWAEAATDAAHARLFHRDYVSQLQDILPVMVYKDTLTLSEQAEVIKWLDWYYVITQGGVILSQSTDIITQ